MSEKPKKERFEDHLRTLEEVVKAIESGSLSLEEAMEKYEAGVAAHAKCKEILGQLEKKIEQLVRQHDGTLVARPLEPQAAPKKKKADEDLPF